ncbi:MAG: acetylxylan esterase, partial [Planctomycetes bacterium]|nr:acetylxylan esterase [Planctomycetota bacterium]
NITTAFPHWFTPTYAGYADDPAHCPVDQHQLIALIAPRAVYVASASQDTWADPEGEFLAARAASPVWRLFGREGLDFESWPAANLPVGVFVGYHVRAGGHDLTAYDWEQYLAFAERHWRR